MSIDLTLPTAKFVRELERNTSAMTLPDTATANLYELSTTVEVDIMAVILLIVSGHSMPSPHEFVPNADPADLDVYADHIVVVTDSEPFDHEDGTASTPAGSFVYAALADGRFVPLARTGFFTDDTVTQHNVLDQTEALRTVGFQVI